MMIRTLYVDDEPALLELTQLYLERLGDFRIDTVDSASKALELLKKNRYDAIVSDYEMPGMNGIGFLKKVRTAGDTIPFIIFTGKGREEVVIEALNAGVDFYLQKGGDVKAQFAELAYKVRQAVQHRAAEQRIEDLERREMDILNFLPDPTFAIDTTGRVLVWNRAMAELSGIPAAQMVGKNNYEYAVPFYGERRPVLIDLIFEPSETIEKQYTNITRVGNELIAETNLPHPKGVTLTLMGKAGPIFNRQGQIVGAIETLRDIDERKRAEEKLRESEERFRNVVEDQTEFICRFLPDGTHIFANEACCRYFDKKKEDLVGHKFVPAIPREDHEPVRRHFASLTPEHPVETITHRIVLPSGEVRWQQWNDRAIFGRDGRVTEYQSVGRDVTRLKKAEMDLTENEEKFRTLFEGANDAIFVMDGETFLECNRRCEEVFQAPRDRVIGRSPVDFSPEIQPDGRRSAEKAREMIHAALSGKPRFFEWVHLHADGSPFSAEVSLNRFHLRDHYYLQAIVRDITDRKETEDQLRESERITRAIFDSAFHLIGLVSLDGILLDANRTALDFIGLSKEDVINRPFWETPWWAGDEQRVQQLKDAIREAARGKFVRYEVKFTSISGSPVVTDFSLKPILAPDGMTTMLVAEGHDISKLKRVQESYLRANEKLNLLTDVTRHDILNQLLALSGFLELAKEFVNAPQGESFLKRCEDSVKIIQEQITFTKDYQNIGIKSPEWQDIPEIISRVSKSFIPGSLAINQTCDTLEVYADPLIEKVFYNLIENALRHGGSNLDRIDFSYVTDKKGNCVVVYEDNGVGVAVEDKPRIFDRNFGKHTGFGLFLAAEILSITGITIAETGTPGKGARFEITVPPGKYRLTGTSK